MVGMSLEGGGVRGVLIAEDVMLAVNALAAILFYLSVLQALISPLFYGSMIKLAVLHDFNLKLLFPF